MPELNSFSEKSKKQLVYERLKDMIITNELKPGSLLVERQLCTLLDASRTPIREAIHQLVNDKLVVTFPNKGSYVSDVHYEDISQVYDVREYLEKLAGKLCCQNILPDQLMQLEQSALQMTEELYQDDLDHFYLTDLNFHMSMVRFSRNNLLLNTYETIYPQLQRITYLIHSTPYGLKEADSYHIKIVQAMKNKDIADTEYQIGEHIRIIKMNYLKLFAPNLF